MRTRLNAYQPSRFRLRPDVRRALARLNLSQNEFARQCRVSSGYMSQLLTGSRCAGPEVRARILGIIGLDFDSMFEEVSGDD